MKKTLFVLTILLTNHILYGQNATRDSLSNLLKTAKSDSSKLSILQETIRLTMWSDPEYALKLAKQQLLLSKSVGDRRVEVIALQNHGTILSVLGDYPLAIDFHVQSIKLIEAFQNADLALPYLNISEAYSDAGDYSSAIAYAYKGKNIVERMRPNDSTSFFKMIAWTYVGEVYEKFDHLDSALFYLKKARLLDSTLFHGQSGFNTLHLAGTYAKKNQPGRAIKYYRQTIVNSKIHNYKSDLMDAYNGLAKTFIQTGQNDSAVFYVEQTILLGKTTKYPLSVLKAVTLLSNIYRKQNKLDSAFKYIDLSTLMKDSLFNQAKIRRVQDISFVEKFRQQELQQRIEQNKLEYRNRLNIYVLLTGLVLSFLVALGLWRRSVYRRKTIGLLEKQKEEIQRTFTQLKSTQSQLIQSEKMASLGELTAGIAHEIQNPLNFVNNFSEVNEELIDELTQELAVGNKQSAEEIAKDIKTNQQKILHHGKRADAIVKGMLQHSRSSTGVKEPTNINALADEYLRMAFHGLRAKDKSFNATVKTDFDETIGNVNVVPQDIGRVILNLITNAFYVVNEKSKQGIAGYEPTVEINTKKTGYKVLISVKDNGNGIPQKILDKIFQPFFTTKPTGQGTGLGLSLSYDIMKAHGGELKVDTKDGDGAEFIIIFPLS